MLQYAYSQNLSKSTHFDSFATKIPLLYYLRKFVKKGQLKKTPSRGIIKIPWEGKFMPKIVGLTFLKVAESVGAIRNQIPDILW